MTSPPLPPADPALPALHGLLDPEAAAPVLGRSLGAGARLEDVRLIYAQFKRGRRLIAGYRATIDGARHDAVAMLDTKADLAARARLPEHAARARLVADDRVHEPLRFEPDLDALVQWLPFDIALPALSLPPDRLAELLAEQGLDLPAGPPRGRAPRPRAAAARGGPAGRPRAEVLRQGSNAERGGARIAHRPGPRFGGHGSPRGRPARAAGHRPGRARRPVARRPAGGCRPGGADPERASVPADRGPPRATDRERARVARGRRADRPRHRAGARAARARAASAARRDPPRGPAAGRRPRRLRRRPDARRARGHRGVRLRRDLRHAPGDGPGAVRGGHRAPGSDAARPRLRGPCTTGRCLRRAAGGPRLVPRRADPLPGRLALSQGMARLAAEGRVDHRRGGDGARPPAASRRAGERAAGGRRGRRRQRPRRGRPTGREATAGS